MIDQNHKALSISRQCQLLSFSRTGFYYKPEPVSEENRRIMDRIDELFLESPEYGSRIMRDLLRIIMDPEIKTTS